MKCELERITVSYEAHGEGKCQQMNVGFCPMHLSLAERVKLSKAGAENRYRFARNALNRVCNDDSISLQYEKVRRCQNTKRTMSITKTTCLMSRQRI